ncbi:MAG: MFS transporter, partial [Actinomycetota bacterium]|nr:MFS transporter [Actinomycetota bacterium]
PVLDVGFFRQPAFTGANVVAFCTYFGTFALFFFVPLYLQLVGSSSGYDLALDFIPMAVALVVASAYTGRWVAAVGPRVPMVTGCVMAAAGLFATDLVVTPTAGPWQLAWTFALAGAGFGIAIVPVTASVLSVVPAARSGMAASATNTSRELGAVAGVSVLGTIVYGKLTVDLSRSLTSIGIPGPIRVLVIRGVTTGQSAKGLGGGPAIDALIAKVEKPAYAAFGNGLNVSLWMAGALLLGSAAVAAATMRRRPQMIDPDATGSSPAPIR